MENEQSKFGVPAAIVIAGVIIALAVMYSGGGGGSSEDSDGAADAAKQKQEQQRKLAENIQPVKANDHILGNPNAPVKIVEFSDIECPFCKRFHPTLHQIVDELGKNGDVAWVYRHFPLDIHPKATPEAEATECAAEQGGNDMFWQYLDKLFEASLSNNQTDALVPRKIAEEMKLDMVKFDSCVKNRTYKDKVAAQIKDGLNSGVTGTPYSIVIAKSGEKFPINGALPYANVKAIVEQAIKAK